MRFSGGHRAAIAFDPQGLVFAAAGGGGQTKLFDVRAYGKGPFTTFAPDVGGPVNFSCVKFSYDGKLMLLGTTQGTLLLLDAFNGELVRSFSGHDNAQQLPLEACFRCGAAEGASNRLAPASATLTHLGPRRAAAPTRTLFSPAPRTAPSGGGACRAARRCPRCRGTPGRSARSRSTRRA